MSVALDETDIRNKNICKTEGNLEILSNKIGLRFIRGPGFLLQYTAT
jgi:hypothetical protein